MTMTCVVQVPSGKLEVALGKLRQFNQRRHRSIKTGIFSKKVSDAICHYTL